MTIEELIEKRKLLLKAHKENNFSNGIETLLTDLYPDKAHFIFELLQNAEDMNATEVKFTLNTDSLLFEHNGSKRDFNINDIDAITNIGHNIEKKQDKTSIGKFGVGFKAVFSYTKTPEIHSGKYHFRIKDYFIPEFENVEQLDTIDENGVAWTKFYFPFDNPKKTIFKAHQEIFNGLNGLNDNSILFLNHIIKITYSFTDTGKCGYIEKNLRKVGNNSAFVDITYKSSFEIENHTSSWLKFDDTANIIINGITKNYPIAIAYLLEKNNVAENQIINIVPIKNNGKIFIYFPTEKEVSNFKFHINAPFSCTVARDSICNCIENNKLLENIGKLIVRSISEIKSLNLLNMSFLATLPNKKDDINSPYSNILNLIFKSFVMNDYLLTKDNKFTSVKKGIICSKEISDIIDEVDFYKLTGIKKQYIANALKNTRESDFLNSLNIQEFTYNNFLKMFSPVNNKVFKYLLDKPNSFLLKFYNLCDIATQKEKSFDLLFMKEYKFIKTTKDNLYYSNQCCIMLNNDFKVYNNVNIVDPYFVVPNKESQNILRMKENTKHFFLNVLQIPIYDKESEINNLVDYIESRLKSIYNLYDIDKLYKNYFIDLISVIEYYMKCKNNNIRLQNKSIFIGYNPNPYGNTLVSVPYNSLNLGEEYGGYFGHILPNNDKYLLWENYANLYNENQFKIFMEFLKQVNVSKTLEIIETSSKYNPMYYEKLYSQGKTSSHVTDIDYTIQNLKFLLNKKSVEINLIIWNLLLEQSLDKAQRYSYAKYSPNNSISIKTYDSTLIYYLKNTKWIPDKNSDFFKPEEISINDLNERFVYNKNNILLKNLNFNSKVSKNKKKIEDMQKEAEKLGQILIPMEDAEIYEEAKRLIQERKNIHSKDIDDLLKSEDKKTNYKSIKTNDMDFFDGADITSTFKNASNQVERKLFSKVVASNKKEKSLLEKWYHGECQMCGFKLRGASGKFHFYARNIISSNKLSNKLLNSLPLCWNSISLCPNCSMKYSVCSKEISNLSKQIKNKRVNRNDTYVLLEFKLNNITQYIKYNVSHFKILQKVYLELLKE